MPEKTKKCLFLRELDIITEKCIIEVKSGTSGTNLVKQFSAQKRYAEYRNKQHIVFAPNFPTMARVNFQRLGFNVVADFKSLIKAIKEYE